jgi:2'-5' RNA ligase
MNSKSNLYFIAIIPPQEICEAITAIKHDFAERFKSSKALRVIPHITLKAPFKFPAEKHTEVLRWFTSTNITVNSFQQELKDFGSFANKRNPVIFIEPLMNESLKTLQKNILSHFIKEFGKEQVAQNEYKFNPHMTVAYRDLLYHQYKMAWEEYQSTKFEATFEVNSFHLLQHDGKKWNSIKEFVLLKDSL